MSSAGPADEFDRLWNKLSREEKIYHISAIEHLTAKYGAEISERPDLELRLLKKDQELMAILKIDPPLSLPSFDENGKRLDPPPLVDFIFEREKVENADTLHLGEVVGWIISRGVPIKSQDAVARWDSVLDDVLVKIAKSEIKAEGISSRSQKPKRLKPSRFGEDFADNRSVYILPTKPTGKRSGLRRAEMHIDRQDELPFQPYKRSWTNITLPSVGVLRLWPPLDAERSSVAAAELPDLTQLIPSNRSSKEISKGLPKPSGAASPDKLSKYIKRACEYALEQNWLPPTKEEISKKLLSNVNRNTIRKVCLDKSLKHFFGGRGRRKGPKNNNRHKELDKIRQLFPSAN